jgi:hypothetical protein
MSHHLPSSSREECAPNKHFERRASARYQPIQEISCSLSRMVGEAPCPARLLDVSQGGIGLLVEQPVEPGTSVLVTLQNRASRFQCSELVYVRHVTEQSGGTYHVGCEFIKKLTRGDLRTLASIADGPAIPCGPRRLQRQPAQSVSA